MVTLDKILGQRKALKTIDRIISQGKRGQAILITGPEGRGKFALANHIGMRFLCGENNSACGKCFTCKNVMTDNHPDFLLVFPFPNVISESKQNTLFHFSDPVKSDARFSKDTLDEVIAFKELKAADPYRIQSFSKKPNIPVSVIRDLIKAVAKKPMMGSRRAVIITDIDKMAYGAADLFLKTVEEPPEDSLVVMTASYSGQLLPTLLSRTLKIQLAPVGDDLINGYLAEYDIKENSEFYICYSNGGPGMALKAHEDEILATRDEVFKFFSEFVDSASLSDLIAHVRFKYQWIGFDDARIMFNIFEKILRDIYIVKLGLDKNLVNIDISKKLKVCADKAPGPEILVSWFKSLAKASRVHRVNNVAFDTALMGMFIEFDRASKKMV